MVSHKLPVNNSGSKHMKPDLNYLGFDILVKLRDVTFNEFTPFIVKFIKQSQSS